MATNRWISSLLSTATGRRAFSIGYRQAPEHRFPAAVEDSLTAYRWLLASGTPADRLIVAGNSAGGGLALATLVAIRDAGDPPPVGAIALSPWTDLTASGASMHDAAELDAMLTPEGVRASAELYVDAAERDHPHASPVFADLGGLPPILLQAGTAEILRDDTARFADRARAAGVEVTGELWDDLPHVWHAFAGVLPEADAAWERIGRWVAELDGRGRA